MRPTFEEPAHFDIDDGHVRIVEFVAVEEVDEW